MSSILKKLTDAGLAHPPEFVVANDSIQYMTIMGSEAYGVAQDTSDKDVYGFCMPPLDMVFPHLRGEIPGFGKQKQNFQVYQEHHIASGNLTYDISVYSIVKYFNLMLDCNPNMIDSLFTPEECVLTGTKISKMVRDNRKKFLHKGAYHRYLGYAFSQLSKMKNKTNHENVKRNDDIQKYGYSLKYGYHLVRLAEEAKQILNTGDMDLRGNIPILMRVRAGEMTLVDLEEHLKKSEVELADAYKNSKLPHEANEPEVKKLLLSCMEEYYGKLELFKL
jgi:predicted nucleotidyltransferase